MHCYLLLLLPLIYSCVTNKKVTYLQHETDKDKELVRDSVYRELEIQDFQYRLQSEDVISISILTVSPSEYNFFTPALAP